MVGLILVFIFVAPHYVNFRDQPKAASVVMLPDGAFHIETRLLSGISTEQQAAKATELVNARYKTHYTIARVEPIMGEEDEILGYTAFANR